MCVVFVLVYVYDWQGRTAVANCQANNQSISQSTQQWRKSAPPILSTSQCKLNGACSCAHTKNHPLAPIHPFSKQMVPSLCLESLTRHSLRLFSPVLCVRLIKGFLPLITFLCAHRFFFFLCFIFIAHFLVGLRELV